MKFGYSNGSHYWVTFYQHLTKILPGNHSVSTGVNCDVFFYSYWNVSDSLKCKKGTKLVFISGECQDVSRFPCSLLIDCKFGMNKVHSRFLYYPFYALSFFERPTGANEKNLIKPPSYDAHAILKTKKRFCAFMYRYDLDFRVQLFDDINAYKRVDALGKSRNDNFKTSTSDRGSASYLDNAVASYQPFKFVICCENQRAPGYVTEKIINAMLANAIPIYFGAPDVADHFNPKSFINMGAFPSRKEAIRFIQQVDENDELYCSMLSQPWFHNNLLPSYFDTKYIQDAFAHIVRENSNQSPTMLSPHRHINRNSSVQRKMWTAVTRQKQQPVKNQRMFSQLRSLRHSSPRRRLFLTFRKRSNVSRTTFKKARHRMQK